MCQAELLPLGWGSCPSWAPCGSSTACKLGGFGWQEWQRSSSSPLSVHTPHCPVPRRPTGEHPEKYLFPYCTQNKVPCSDNPYSSVPAILAALLTFLPSSTFHLRTYIYFHLCFPFPPFYLTCVRLWCKTEGNWKHENMKERPTKTQNKKKKKSIKRAKKLISVMQGIHVLWRD